MVDPVKDSQWEGDDGICGRRAEIVGRKAAHDLVCDMVGGFDGELQCCGVSHAGSVEVGGLDILLPGERLNLFGSAVHNHHSDIQGTQEGDIDENVGEILVCDHTSIHCDNEGFLPELRDVLQDCAQVCELHRSSGLDLVGRIEALIPDARERLPHAHHGLNSTGLCGPRFVTLRNGRL